MLTYKRALISAVFFMAVLVYISMQQSPQGLPLAVSTIPSSSQVVKLEPESSNKALLQHQVPNARPILDMSKFTLYDKLEYLFPYDVKVRFPAYIWQTWKTTPSHHDFKFREHEASWTDQHPGFIHEVITDEVAPSLLKVLYSTLPDVLEAYDSLPRPVLKADFFRYLILLARGGIYTDIDTVALRSAVEWIPEVFDRDMLGLIIGIEADPDRLDWHDWYSRRVQFCQWTIQAKPGHPVLREIVARITEDTLRRKHAGRLVNFPHEKVIEFTGPAIWTDVVMDYLNDPRYFDMAQSKEIIDWHKFTGMEEPRQVGDVLVLPITSFSPGVGQMGAKDYDDSMAYVKHDFEGKKTTKRAIYAIN